MGPSSFRALIVEDDLALQPFWKIVLKRCFQECELDWAVSAEHAKCMIQQSERIGTPYSLIISDIFLAGSETGLDLLKSEIESQTATKFLLVSAAEADRIKDTLGWISDSVVLTKPLNVPKCERAIYQLLKLEA